MALGPGFFINKKRNTAAVGVTAAFVVVLIVNLVELRD
jgi:hypothetical protein